MLISQAEPLKGIINVICPSAYLSTCENESPGYCFHRPPVGVGKCSAVFEHLWEFAMTRQEMTSVRKFDDTGHKWRPYFPPTPLYDVSGDSVWVATHAMFVEWCACLLRTYVRSQFVCEGRARERKSASADQTKQPLDSCSYGPQKCTELPESHHSGNYYHSREILKGGHCGWHVHMCERTVGLIDVFDVNNIR